MNEEMTMADKDVTDEMRIQFAIDEMYEFNKSFDGEFEKTTKMKLLRNNILNMMDTYLKKFQNEIIMRDWRERLKKAKQKATNNGRVNKYWQFMNELRVIQEFKGIKENIADKLAEQLFKRFENSEVIEHAVLTKGNDTE